MRRQINDIAKCADEMGLKLLGLGAFNKVRDFCSRMDGCMYAYLSDSMYVLSVPFPCLVYALSSVKMTACISLYPLH